MHTNNKLKHFIDLHKSTTMKILGTMLLFGLFCLMSLPQTTLAANSYGVSSLADPPDDTYYYEYTQVVFADDVDTEGNLIDEKTIFTLPSDGPANITVALFNEEPLLTSEITVEIYKDGNTLFDSFSIEIKEEWNWCKFRIDVLEPGKYTIDLYNEIDVFINSGYVEVVK